MSEEPDSASRSSLTPPWRWSFWGSGLSGFQRGRNLSTNGAGPPHASSPCIRGSYWPVALAAGLAVVSGGCFPWSRPLRPRCWSAPGGLRAAALTGGLTPVFMRRLALAALGAQLIGAPLAHAGTAPVCRRPRTAGHPFPQRGRRQTDGPRPAGLCWHQASRAGRPAPKASTFSLSGSRGRPSWNRASSPHCRPGQPRSPRRSRPRK